MADGSFRCNWCNVDGVIRNSTFYKSINVDKMKKIKELCFILLASAFGLGLMPVAPGSFGALLGVGIHLAIVRFVSLQNQQYALIAGLVVVSLVHFMLTPWAQKHWRESDPGHFVLDEVAGYLVVPLLIRTGPVWFIAVGGFLAFRVIDIIKIPPARQIDQNIHDAWGILLDDIVSGLYATGIIWIAIKLLF